MTRDEAIKIQKRHTPTNVVDILADLGLLKLDEPKSAEHRFIEVINNLPHDFRLSGNIWAALNLAGLKIVEK